MPAFTMELWEVIETTGGTLERDADGNNILTGGDIGLSFYKPFIPEHKKILDGKIIDHFYNREIAHETIDLFKFAVQRKLNEIMPLYNKLYESELLEFDPLSTIKIHTLATSAGTEAVKVDGTSESDTTSASGSRTVNLELPQVPLSGDGDYATAGVDANGTATGATNSVDSREQDTTTNNDVDTTVEGYQAYPSNLIAQYRAILLNIDMMIVKELEVCFMGLWDNGDSYSGTTGFGGGYFYGFY